MLRSNRPNLDWDDEHGDRLTEFVVIGTGIDENELIDRLDDALVTDEEWEAIGSDAAAATVDFPFPTEQGEAIALREP